MTTVVSLIAGGTAGHIEPALAVARRIRVEREEIVCEFVGTKRGLETSLIPEAGFVLRTIRKVPMPRKISLKILTWPFEMCIAMVETFQVLKKSNLIIGFGGYVSAPCYFIGWLLRIPIVIHEQNAKPGWANRFGAYFTDSILLAFSGARKTSKRWKNAQVIGMPLRESLLEVARMEPEMRRDIRKSLCARTSFNPDLPLVVVFGGSQGARRINDTIFTSLPALASKKIQIIHGVGKGNSHPDATEYYLPYPYLDNMPELYAAADLVIARSGAVTCSELSAAQVFSLLIPLPIGNGEQRANAQDLLESGIAEVIDNSHITNDWLIENIEQLLTKALMAKNHLVPKTIPDAALSVMQVALQKLQPVGA